MDMKPPHGGGGSLVGRWARTGANLGICLRQLAISPTECVASTLDIGRTRRRLEATASSFTPSDWVLATASLVVIEATWHEYLMMVRTNVWLPTLVDSGVPFGFLVTEVFMVHFLSADHRLW